MTTRPDPAPQLQHSDLLRRHSLISKILQVISKRPGHIIPEARSFLLFSLVHWSYRLIPNRAVHVGKNVRVQRRRSLFAEAPEASLYLGDNVIVYEGAELSAFGKSTISIGRDSIIGRTKLVCRKHISIGKRFLSSWGVLIQDFDPHPIEQDARAAQVSDMVRRFSPAYDGGYFEESLTASKTISKPSFESDAITIGDDVWVGAQAIILKGAMIGDGSIVAAGAVVVRGDYPARSLLAGNPAKVVRSLPLAKSESLVETSS